MLNSHGRRGAGPTRRPCRSRGSPLGGSVVAAEARSAACRRAELFQLDAGSGFLQLSLQLLGLVLLDALLDGLRGLVHQGLGLLEPQAGRRPDDLDDLNLLVAGPGQEDVERRLLLLPGAVTARGRRRRSRRCDCARGHAELLLERLDALGKVHHRNRLQLVDPFLCRGHGYSASFCVSVSVSSGVSVGSGSADASVSAGASSEEASVSGAAASSSASTSGAEASAAGASA